ADHPQVYGAAADRPGIAYVDLDREVPAWLVTLVADAASSSDVVLVTPHWGPNMTTAPVPHVLTGSRALAAAGAGIIAGHSAHVFHGVTWDEGTCVLYDMGDFLDDYAVDPHLRNDLGVLWTVHLDGTTPVRVDAMPLRLDVCRTDVAAGSDAAWVEQRLRRACEGLPTVVDRVEQTLQCRAR
ncbi:MAG: CapA family protein, partial [Nitriliruptorales bacterium]|nr:CapA family protein [Nitriliruptorales bacterium]